MPHEFGTKFFKKVLRNWHLSFANEKTLQDMERVSMKRQTKNKENNKIQYLNRLEKDLNSFICNPFGMWLA